MQKTNALVSRTHTHTTNDNFSQFQNTKDKKEIPSTVSIAILVNDNEKKKKNYHFITKVRNEMVSVVFMFAATRIDKKKQLLMQRCESMKPRCVFFSSTVQS